jgi:hypothetical protein
MRPPSPATAPARAAALAIFTAFFSSPVALLAATPTRPQPPPPRKVLYDPDQVACRAEHLESHAREQLRPWADQPPEVLARLRLLQGEMLRASLRRCLARGLITPAEAAAVEQRLGFQPGAAALTPQSSEIRP